jgi:hypothetical protein
MTSAELLSTLSLIAKVLFNNNNEYMTSREINLHASQIQSTNDTAKEFAKIITQNPTLFESTVIDKRTKFRLSQQGQTELVSSTWEKSTTTKPIITKEPKEHAVNGSPPRGISTSHFSVLVLLDKNNQWMTSQDISKLGIESKYNDDYPESSYTPQMIYCALTNANWFESKYVDTKRHFRLNKSGLEKAEAVRTSFSKRKKQVAASPRAALLSKLKEQKSRLDELMEEKTHIRKRNGRIGKPKRTKHTETKVAREWVRKSE